MKKVVYLPLDERPCNLALICDIAEDNKSFRLIAPELEEMGSKKTPARYRDVENFLERECGDADYLIIAIDTLLYGGIIPSRLHHTDKSELLERLSLLRKIKEKNKKLYICAFSLVMRCPCYSDSSEEPDYYAECGREIFLWGQNEHKLKLGLITHEEYTAECERLGACKEFIGDYTTRRASNLACLTEVIRMMGTVIDDFTILQDDSNPYGYTTMDREVILLEADRLGVKVDIYPGADEGGLVMLARVASYIEGKKPRVYVDFPREGARNVTPIYEDREVHKTISAQIKSAGASECTDTRDADFVLFCNLNDECTYDVYLNYTAQADESYHEAFAKKIAETLKSGVGAAVADIAYCNSGDYNFVKKLDSEVGLLNLWGYAGWNTASNTLGTVMCQAVLRYLYGDTLTHRRFTAARVMDDAVYMAFVRREMKSDCATGADLDRNGKHTEKIIHRINEVIRKDFADIGDKYKAVGCYLPWNRLFEIRLEVKEK